ncbi:MAG: ABC transporter ATP-binding protein [Clostridia bacterium]|nr:ABC transporter ATP-binding protein [Clostridia bacterium]
MSNSKSSSATVAPIKGGRNFEKPKDAKKSWGKLFGSMKKYLPLMVIALILASASVVFTLIGPNQISDLTNLIQQGLATSIDMHAIMDIVILLVILYLTGALFQLIQGLIMSWITQSFSRKLRYDISKKINRLPLKYLDSHSYGDVLSRVTNDVDTIGQSLNNSIVSLVTSIVMFVGSLVMMFVTNWIMALAAIASTAIGFSIMGVIMKKSQKYFKAQQKSLGQINGHVEETYSGHTVVKAYNAEKQVKAKFEEINNELYNSAWKSQFLSGLMMPLMSFVGNFGYVVVCVVGVALAISGYIGFGVIVAFMIYIRLFTQPLSQMAQALTMLQSTAAASERVFEFLDEKEMKNEHNVKFKFSKQFKVKDLIIQKEKVKHFNNLTLKQNLQLNVYKQKYLDPKLVKGDVEFKNVKFGYKKGKLVIKDFSVSVKAGQKVAIVGPTGAGKTTLVNLLMRFYELNGGNIYIDGVPTNELTRENVHEMFSMVLQDTWMFEGTIKENIVYSKKDVTDEQVIEACKTAGVDHFIRTLPEGYDTIMDDNTSISAGQKQLLTIARAMVKNGPMLILDEATSSVDTRTEELIQQAMDKLMKNRTSFVIAHRLSTIKNSDIILVMKDGDIIESGNHEELIAKNGFYAELYNSQFEN